MDGLILTHSKKESVRSIISPHRILTRVLICFQISLSTNTVCFYLSHYFTSCLLGASFYLAMTAQLHIILECVCVCVGWGGGVLQYGKIDMYTPVHSCKWVFIRVDR